MTQMRGQRQIQRSTFWSPYVHMTATNASDCLFVFFSLFYTKPISTNNNNNNNNKIPMSNLEDINII